MDRKIMIIEHENNCSQSKHVSNNIEENSLKLKKINATIINAVEFCSNILSRNGLGVSFHIDKFKSYSDIAGAEIKFLVNSRNMLLKLLRSFPLLFHVVDNQVTLRSWIIFHLNQQEWLKELLPNSFHPVPIFICAIQFYCNELFKIAPTFELPLCQLFNHRSKAPAAIQTVTRNTKEFLLFLQMYPDIFHLNGEKVLLSKSAAAYKSLREWIKRLLVCDFTLAKHIADKESVAERTAFDYIVLKNEVAVYEAVGFHYNLIFTSDAAMGKSLWELLNNYNKLVPNSPFLKNIVDLENFITSYPEVFKLINKTVFLTHFHPNDIYSECTSEKGDHLNCSLDNGLDLKSIEQTVISFYLGIFYPIFKLPSKITEFSINHLLYYNDIAPPEVRKVAKDVKNLKNFFSKYPQIFKINNADNISFVKTDIPLNINKYSSTPTIDLNINEKKTFEECVSFYTNIIYNLGGTAKIKQLLDCKEIQSLAINFDELKNFFYSHQNDFIVVNDTVSLANKYKEDNSKVNTLNNHSSLGAVKNAISFYSNVLRNHKSRSVSLINISGHRGIAPTDVRTVAKNPKELKILFSQFPEVFTIVDDDKVMLSKPCQEILPLQQQQETSSKMVNNAEQDAVKYFSEMLNHNGNCRVLSIKKLFELKLSSSSAIQKISGSNIEQFLVFLNKYPQEFIVTNDNVIARKKIPKWSDNRKYENKKFTDPLLLVIFHFLKAFTSNKSFFNIDHLYNNVGRFFLYNDKTPVFPSKRDLLLFLGLYPHIFFVDYCRIMNIIASSRKAIIYSIHSQRNNRKSSRTKSIKPKAIVPNLKSAQSLSLPKSSSKKIERNILNNTETNQKDVKKLTPIQSSNSIQLKVISSPAIQEISGSYKIELEPGKRNRTKPNISTCVFPVVEPSTYGKTLESEMSKSYDEVEERVINSSTSQKLEDCLEDKQCSPCKRIDCKEEFNPSSIEEIENNILSHFISKMNKNYYHISKNNKEHASSHIGKSLNYNFLKDINGKENFDESVGEALLFLNGKLWDEGNLKILNIEELFNLFSQSELGMTNKCCKSLTEFMNFLCEFPDQFIVSQEKVMAKRNKIQKVSYLFNNEEESVTIMLFNFFNLYTEQSNFILIKQLFGQVGKYFCNINRSPFFKSPGDLVLFLEMFPNVFHIDNAHIENLTASKETFAHKVKFNSGVIKIHSFLDHKLYSTVTNVKSFMVPESSDAWKDSVLQKTLIVEDLRQCRVVTAEILDSHKVIALDCEGVNLGASGILTLMQIGLANGQVYLFDIFKEKSMVNNGGLKDILESESILKVIHDSRNDLANLYTEYGVTITQIFDTRVAHHLIVNKGVRPKNIPNRLTAIGFNELCSKYGGNLNVQKDEMKNIYTSNRSYWMSRPLTKDMIAYAALDVASLVPQVLFTMWKQLKEIPEELLWEWNRKHSLSFLNKKDLLFD